MSVCERETMGECVCGAWENRNSGRGRFLDCVGHPGQTSFEYSWCKTYIIILSLEIYCLYGSSVFLLHL